MYVIPFSADGGSSTTELQGTYGTAYIDGLMDYYNTFMPPFRNTSLVSASGRSSKPGGSLAGRGGGGGMAVGGRSPCAATEFISGHQAVGLDAFGPFKGFALFVFIVLNSISCPVC